MQLRNLGRRAALIAGAGTAATILTLSAAGAASAATTGGTPRPTAPPVTLHTPPPAVNHHPPRPTRQCFYSWETETDTITLAGQQGQPGQYGEQSRAETVKVEQLVRVCVTGGQVTVTDAGNPSGWVVAPTPTGHMPITDSYTG